MPAKKSPEPVAVASTVQEVVKTPVASTGGAKKPVAATTPVVGGATKKADVKKTDDKKPVTAGASTTAKSVPVVSATATAAATADGKNDEVKEEQSGGDIILSGLLDKVSSLSTQLKTIQSSLKLLVKEFDKQKKIIDKVQKKKEKAKKSPSGFAKPCKISDELCDFMGIAKGTEQSRTDITRHINSYVKEHNLNNPQNRREFFPDKKLKAILNVKDGEKVTYFVLQRLIAHHFPPSMSKLAAANKAAA